MRRAHDFQGIRSTSGQLAPDLLCDVLLDYASQPSDRRNEVGAGSWNTASWMESGFYSRLVSATGSVTQSATQSTDPVCRVSASASPSSPGIGSGNTVGQDALRLESRLDPRLESPGRPAEQASAGQVTMQVTGQVGLLPPQRREIANGNRNNQLPTPASNLPRTLFATRYSLLAALSSGPGAGETQ